MCWKSFWKSSFCLIIVKNIEFLSCTPFILFLRIFYILSFWKLNFLQNCDLIPRKYFILISIQIRSCFTSNNNIVFCLVVLQVLQGWFSKELHLYTKDKKSPVATLTIATLSRLEIFLLSHVSSRDLCFSHAETMVNAG